MTRTLSVAGTLAVLVLALWIGQLFKGSTLPAVGARAHADDASVAVAASSADVAAEAVDNLAAWPVAAGR